MPHAPVVIVSGAIANKHLHGGAWDRVNWTVGLGRLGCLVFFVEQIRSTACVDDAGHPAPFEESANLRYFKAVTRRFGMGDRSSLICDDGAQVHGVPLTDLLHAAGEAEVLINISGHLTLPSVLRRVRRKAYIDEDPGFTQFWHAQGHMSADLDGHDYHFTVGENIGTPVCDIPTGGFNWRRQPRFVLLDEWPMCREGDRHRFTTVGAWRGSFGPVEHHGRKFGLKVHEFRKIIDLPRRARQSFELALSIHPADEADRRALVEHGWRLVDPREVADGPEAFRRYVQLSGGECSAAQGIYVETHSGWVSDRTVQYLASGKPCLVQDTGFSRTYATGEGLVPFRTLDEAVSGAARIERDYEQHAEAARELAVTCFDSDRVLPEILEQMDVML